VLSSNPSCAYARRGIAISYDSLMRKTEGEEQKRCIHWALFYFEGLMDEEQNSEDAALTRLRYAEFLQELHKTRFAPANANPQRPLPLMESDIISRGAVLLYEDPEQKSVVKILSFDRTNEIRSSNPKIEKGSIKIQQLDPNDRFKDGGDFLTVAINDPRLHPFPSDQVFLRGPPQFEEVNKIVGDAPKLVRKPFKFSTPTKGFTAPQDFDPQQSRNNIEELFVSAFLGRDKHDDHTCRRYWKFIEDFYPEKFKRVNTTSITMIDTQTAASTTAQKIVPSKKRKKKPDQDQRRSPVGPSVAQKVVPIVSQDPGLATC